MGFNYFPLDFYQLRDDNLVLGFEHLSLKTLYLEFELPVLNLKDFALRQLYGFAHSITYPSASRARMMSIYLRTEATFSPSP